jgi:hypothetical protein
VYEKYMSEFVATACERDELTTPPPSPLRGSKRGKLF